MKTITLFSAKSYDKTFFDLHNNKFNLQYIDARLTAETAVLAKGSDAICVFVNDELSQKTLIILNELGINKIAFRCAGINNIDLTAAKSLGFTLMNVPAYSPEAIAEHTLGLILTLSRKYHKAYNRVKEDNFSLTGLLGFNLHGKTVGIIGTGKIGLATLKILKGFGCKLLGHDLIKNAKAEELGVDYVDLDTLYSQADIISLHCPLTDLTHHLINKKALSLMKPGVTLINTSRGGLLDTPAIIASLKTGHIGYLGLDVYEQEDKLFFEDRSNTIINDDVFQRLLTFPNVVITGHQGFFTEEALTCIVQTTLSNLDKMLAS
ncbi:2-hydroxyacid dehydrogenase [Algibacillus agarilyticus]|uniref:2-hydroxyacid dehydrogenase n=1 Tax=Algibacillus agarilyticus TaxID=2234133 RepID=UPI000DD08ADD|nr:2-hydroxyacid dehydrogenase [Algibacillus agarilyticus]